MAFNKEQFIEDLKAMSVLELKEVVEAIEETFGVSAQPVSFLLEHQHHTVLLWQPMLQQLFGFLSSYCLFCFLFTCKVTKNFVTVGNSLIISSWRSINSIYSTAHILNRLSTPITFYAERNY